MFSSLLKSIFGTSNERYLKSLSNIVEKINSFEVDLQILSDEQLANKTIYFKEKLADGQTLDDILPEAFAVVRETSKRVLGQRHYDVQLIGGIVLHQGKIAEMRTGEGKTLVATLATYLNALSGKGVHIVTVNDYLAKRDAEWMGKIYKFLQLSVGVIVHGQTDDEKREAYACDITYGTNNEYGFDYLRDNMKFSLEEMTQRPFNFAIVDEVDSILIDEARTPLIISGPVEDRSDLYQKINKYIPKLDEKDFEKDEKNHSIVLTEEGNNKLEILFREDGIIREASTLYDVENLSVVHHANQALKAHKLFTRDKDYLVKEGKILIIDEFTGRVLEGRRYSDGLHQAIEAKEGVKIQSENQTLASITFQNYFRLYPKLSGMTGTASTEAAEFQDIYNLEVIEIPTNKAVARIDDEDHIYRTEIEKFEAITKLIIECNQKNQPVLAGTASVEKSELLSKHLKKAGIKHYILNAKQHEKEAYVIAQAGRPGAVMVATNMAGRGTDIQLGGNADLLIEEKILQLKQSGITDAKIFEDAANKIKSEVERDKEIVKQAGGLCVIGTERHESRRIDNQLRGRSGRQGDNGYSKFFLSAEDDLIRIFGADKKMDWVLGKMGTPGEPIEHPLITRMMEKAQARVEARNYEIRKNLLKFDDVMNEQRKVIYDQRINIMRSENVREKVTEIIDATLDKIVSTYIPKNSYKEQWQIDALKIDVNKIFGLNPNVSSWLDNDEIDDEKIFNLIFDELENFIKKRDNEFSQASMYDLEKRIMLFSLDEVWKEHLHFLDMLRQGINLRSYAQKDPLNEYKQEAFEAFGLMIESFNEKFLTRLFHIHIQNDEEIAEEFRRLQEQKNQKIHATHIDPNSKFGFSGSQMNPSENGQRQAQVTIRTHIKSEDRNPNDPSTWGKVSRNEPCPCGSGQKYKNCHGKI
ncbi:MAG: preprotein translocase subunit SecA [Rickettsiales bacterium]|nr:preprotein translocase subunit SecA [Rickettsiales bacterium]